LHENLVADSGEGAPEYLIGVAAAGDLTALLERK
jgi:hypothetical protein